MFVLDKHHQPLMPCSEKRARLLLERGRARVHKMVPFTIRLVDRLQDDSALQDVRLKLDPGSKATGVAVKLDGAKGTKAVFLGGVIHKPGIKARLDKRRSLRRSRRNRMTRYRKPRFLNRDRKAGWLPPSLEARVDQTMHAATKLSSNLPITAISVEHVKFDTQLMQNAEISGMEYQQGKLMGYEVREYLLEKWGRACVYCAATDVPLEVEHIVPKSRGGTNRVSNLTLPCHACNQGKGKHTVEEFGFPHIQALARKPLRDAAMMNAARWRLYKNLKATGLPVAAGTGGRTKYQRLQHELPKAHYYDALCVRASTPEQFTALPAYVQVWSATGRVTRQMCGTNATGFPIRHRTSRKIHFGFQTGDFVVATVPRGKYAGVWKGRVLIWANGRFDVSAGGKRIAQGISHKYCRIVQHQEGWRYESKSVSA